MLGLADAGAHVGQIMDASQPTFFLSYWVRERQRWSVEEAIRRLTVRHGRALRDRRPRRAAARCRTPTSTSSTSTLCTLPLPEYVHDFPGGAGRYVQGPAGYDVHGRERQVFMEHGEHTGALAGRLLRSNDSEELVSDRRSDGGPRAPSTPTHWSCSTRSRADEWARRAAAPAGGCRTSRSTWPATFHSIADPSSIEAGTTRRRRAERRGAGAGPSRLDRRAGDGRVPRVEREGHRRARRRCRSHRLADMVVPHRQPRQPPAAPDGQRHRVRPLLPPAPRHRCRGADERPTCPTTRRCCEATIEWMLAGIPQMCAEALAACTVGVNLMFTDLRHTVYVPAPGSARRACGPSRRAPTPSLPICVTSAHEFVSWGTKRTDWRPTRAAHRSGGSGHARRDQRHLTRNPVGRGTNLRHDRRTAPRKPRDPRDLGAAAGRPRVATTWSRRSCPASAVPVPDGFGATKEEYVELVHRPARAHRVEHGPVDLVGHDWGGGIGMRAVALRPRPVPHVGVRRARPVPPRLRVARLRPDLADARRRRGVLRADTLATPVEDRVALLRSDRHPACHRRAAGRRGRRRRWALHPRPLPLGRAAGDEGVG